MKTSKFTPTTAMLNAAKEGLTKEHKDADPRLVELAERVVKSEGLDYNDVVQLKEWHEINKDINKEEVSYLLSMGTSGKDWSDRVMDKIGNIKQSQSMGVDSKADLILLSTNQIRVPLAKKGKWYHDSYGVVEFKEEDFTNIVSNHKANKLGFSPYITYGHIDEEPNSTDSHRKRGELVDFKVDEDVLYGDFSVKEDTYELVKDGEYEFSSGEFIRNFTDKDTGEKVGTAFMRVALTNAPFIPFKEKVQALSLSQEENVEQNCIQTVLPFVLVLSINNQSTEPQINPEEEKPVEEVTTELDQDTNTITNNENDMTQEIKPEVVQEASTAPEPVKVETVEELSQETKPEEVKVEEPKPVETKMETDKNAGIDLVALVSQVNSLKTLYETKLDEANTTIGQLTSQIGDMATKLTAQEAVTQAFSQNMSRAQEQALYRRLADEGVMPTVIQKFSSLKGALETAGVSNAVVKLSTNGSEGETKDASLVEAVAELLVSAVSAEPVDYQQFGVAVRKSQAEMYSAGFDDIIKRNQELASKRTVG